MRLLILDECISPKAAGDLTRRGRNAGSTASLGITGSDDRVLRQIAADYPDAVFVTGDDRMPSDHELVLAETRVTLATIDPSRPEEVLQRQWHHEVIQPWAHVMVVQATGTVVRYGAATHRIWTPRKRARHDPRTETDHTAR